VPDDNTNDAAFWRERAQLWQAETEKLTAGNDARVVELEAQVAALAEQVATLSKMLFGKSSEKKSPAPAGSSGSFIPPDDEPRKRGQAAVPKVTVAVITRTSRQKTSFMMFPRTKRSALVVAWTTHCLVMRPASRSTGSSR